MLKRCFGLFNILLLVVFFQSHMADAKTPDERADITPLKAISHENTVFFSGAWLERFMQKDEVHLEVPIVKQLPELARGCEVTSLAMLLKDAGVRADKMTLAKQIKKDHVPYKNEGGKIRFGNPNKGFVGSLYSFQKPGLGVYHGPVANLAKKYIGERALDISGRSFQAVLSQLSIGKPVWVIVTSTYEPLRKEDWETWQTPSGSIKVTYYEHSVLITGFDSKYIYFNDPLSGKKNRKAAREPFIAAWKQMGSQAISYK